jgi:hypothetical protein
VLLAVVAPTALCWLAERAAKSAFLKARGCCLCVRSPLALACLPGASRLPAGSGALGVLGAPAAVAAGALVLWWAAAAIVLSASPQCRDLL